MLPLQALTRSGRNHEQVWHYISNIPDTVGIITESSGKAWHTEERAQGAQSTLQCHLYDIGGPPGASSSLSSDSADEPWLSASRKSSLYMTMVSYNSSGAHSSPNLGNTIASLQTIPPPKLSWIKVFMQAFGFDVEGESVTQTESVWKNGVICNFTIQVKVRG